MAAIRTDGFRVGVMPQVQFADPRQLAPAYGNIIPSISQGLGVYGQFQQIRDEAAMRPIRQQLEQIKLQEAQSRLAQYPLDQQLRLAQIAEAQQNAAVPRVIPGNITLAESQVAPEDMPALDEAGNRTGPMGDLLQITEEQLVGPGGVITPRTVTKTLKTAQQRLVEAEKERAQLEATKALATSRLRGKEQKLEALVQLRDDAIAEGRDDVAEIYNAAITKESTTRPLLTAQDIFDRRVAQLAAANGITFENALILSKTPEGAAAMAKLAVSNSAQGKSLFGAPQLNAEEKALIQGNGTIPNPASPSDFQARLDAVMGGQNGGGVKFEIPISGATKQVAAPAKDKFTVGKTYTDANGNKATYLGDGKWQEIK